MEQEYVVLQLTAMAPTACCPSCAMPSSSVHSHYQRHLTDLPWGARPVHIQLTVRKFVCQNPSGERHIFTERLPDLLAAYARKTHRLVAVLQAIGTALGGQAGARLAARLRLSTSPTSLLRLVRAAPVPHPSALQAVGVDEWAWRRGHRYGTIVVDLATHRVVDLLPDRSAATLAAWLAQHPTITVVCRDRSDLYAEGIRRGAPEAVQVVDRFHLVHNLRQVLEVFLINHRAVLQAAAIGTARALLLRSRPVPITLMYQGRRSAQVLTPYLPYLIRRWRDSGANSMQLWRELQALGYTHSARTVCRFLRQLRRASEAGRSPELERSPYTRPQGPSARAVSFAIVCPAAKRRDTPCEHAGVPSSAWCYVVRS